MSWFVGRLKAALSQVDDPCPFCDGSVAYVKWDAEDRRHKIKVIHPSGCCPAMVPGVWQDRADSWLISLLELHGIRVAEYLDDLVGWHATR